MSVFYDQMFNPNYVNPIYYQQNQMEIMRYREEMRYHQEQNSEVFKAVKAMRDLREALKKMDMPHQRQAFMLCLEEAAKEFNW